MGNGVTEIPYNGILQDSLSVIKQAHRQLHVVTGLPQQHQLFSCRA
jgi:hypothetical protein